MKPHTALAVLLAGIVGTIANSISLMGKPSYAVSELPPASWWWATSSAKAQPRNRRSWARHRISRRGYKVSPVLAVSSSPRPRASYSASSSNFKRWGAGLSRAWTPMSRSISS